MPGPLPALDRSGLCSQNRALTLRLRPGTPAARADVRRRRCCRL